METKKTEFIDVLEKLKIGLSKKDVDKQTGHFIFTSEYVLVCNEEVFIAHPFENDFSDKDCYGVPLEFYELLTKINKDDIKIDFTEDVIKIKAGKVKSELALLQDIVTDALPDFEDLEWGQLPADFIEGVDMCRLSVGSGGHKEFFKCICVHDGNIYSTDDARISKYELEEGQIANFTILGREISKLLKFDVFEYAMDDAWVFFRTKDNVIFSIRQQNVDFPVEDLLGMMEVEGDVIVLPDGMENNIETVMVTAKGESEELKEVTIKIKGSKMTLTGEKERGRTSASMKSGQKKGFEVEFCVSPVFLLKILEKTRNVCIGEGSALFTAGNLTHIQALFT